VNIQERTFLFGVKVIKMAGCLPKTPAGFAISSQVIRSGTSIGANIAEAQDAASKADFTKGLIISLKEARETEFWLKMIGVSGLLSKEELKLLLVETVEIVKILRASVKKLKQG
jgi:four helix bundle protein